MNTCGGVRSLSLRTGELLSHRTSPKFSRDATEIHLCRYKTIHLAALGPAIPHLLTLATSLPEILPHSAETIHTEYKTGTVTCVDEVIPLEDDNGPENGEVEEPKISSGLEKRNKSSLQAVIRIEDGKKEISGREKRPKKGNRGAGRGGRKGKGKVLAGGSDDGMMSTDVE